MHPDILPLYKDGEIKDPIMESMVRCEETHPEGHGRCQVGIRHIGQHLIEIDNQTYIAWPEITDILEHPEWYF